MSIRACIQFRIGTASLGGKRTALVSNGAYTAQLLFRSETQISDSVARPSIPVLHYHLALALISTGRNLKS